MSIDFHDRKYRHSYAAREADEAWIRLMSEQLSVAGKKAADIGCGGGIYTKALSTLGAEEVIGIDFSAAMLEGAQANCKELKKVRFVQGNTLAVPLAEGSVSYVVERALIHHLSAAELELAFKEAYRILNETGTLVVQDRTPEDCVLEGSREHLRGYFFEIHPKLLQKETNRRHSSSVVREALRGAGFHSIEEVSLWETRERYDHFLAFREDLLHRTGRSILHELTDEELRVLAAAIQTKTGYRDEDTVLEKDRWTVWIGRK